MERFGELWRRLLYLFRRKRFNRDLEEEMRFHLEMRAQESGAAAARKKFGNVAFLLEDSREAWGWSALERIARDTRYALRAFRKSPAFTATAIATMALAIGVNTAIFSFVDRLLLRPLPFPESDRLASLYFRVPAFASAYTSVSYPVYQSYRDHNDIFSGVAAYDDLQVNLGADDDVETVGAEIVTANYFTVLGVAPALGRSFRAEEDAVPGRNPVAILSSELWKRRFGGDASIVGRQMAINGVSFTVIGVLPSEFAGLRLDTNIRPSVWVPAMMYPAVVPFGGESDLEHLWGDEWLSAAVARLKPGVTFSQANASFADLTNNMKPLWRAHKLNKDRLSGLLIPANESRFPPESRRSVAPFLAMLMTVVTLVLLIACSNVASLMLARAVRRRTEIGVRLALGAGRARLVQQFLTEGLLLSLMGGAAGIGIALLTVRALAAMRPFGLQVLQQTTIDGRVLAFALGLAALSGLIFGLAPLGQVSRFGAGSGLAAGSPARSPRRARARNILVATQVALSLVLLTGAGLFVRTLRNAQADDVTRNPENVLLVKLDLSQRK
jgi:predicted permease